MNVTSASIDTIDGSRLRVLFDSVLSEPVVGTAGFSLTVGGESVNLEVGTWNNDGPDAIEFGPLTNPAPFGPAILTYDGSGGIQDGSGNVLAAGSWVVQNNSQVNSPVPTFGPSIVGGLLPTVGTPLYAADGATSPTGAALTTTYQWFTQPTQALPRRHLPTAISGATAQSYTPVAADVGQWLSCAVTTTDGTYTQTATLRCGATVRYKPNSDSSGNRTNPTLTP